jgi:hypothetical protein
MSEDAEHDVRRLKRRRLMPFWVGVLFGLMGLVRVLTQPRIASYYTPDIVQLIAVGFCFGVAFVTLISFFQSPP